MPEVELVVLARTAKRVISEVMPAYQSKYSKTSVHTVALEEHAVADVI
jgi:hypothetical protein